ncbi:MAG: methionyl-tRNA formyltransferase [Candidatus Fimenecus sp.]
MRIVFMGTPDFAVPCLQRLLADGEEVVGVFTQPDKPKGRGYELTPPPVKAEAVLHGIPVFQPNRMRDGEALEILKKLNPDLSIVVAYGKILPKEVLELPKFGSVNIHASLLPRYRGAAPIQWCVLNGETQTGVTSMQMNEGLDTGDMLLSKSMPIPPDMTAGELHDALSLLGAEVMAETVQAVRENTLKPVPQPVESNYAPMLTKALCPIDFHKSAQEIHNQVRGLCPWPSATANFNGKRLKIHKTRCIGTCTDALPGTVIAVDSEITVACGDGKAIAILELQPEGKKRMTAKAFLVGHSVKIGDTFQ